MLFIVGTVMVVMHDFTEKTLGLHIMQVFALTALLVFLPQWGNASAVAGSKLDPQRPWR